MAHPSQILTSILVSLHEISQRSIEKSTINESSQPGHEARYRKRTKDRKNKRDLPEEARNTLLTLHVLFPHILLDALDLLDRGCVVRILVKDEHVDGPAQQPQKDLSDNPGREPTSSEKPKVTTNHHVAHYVLSTRQRQPYSKYPSTSSTAKTNTNPTREQVIQQLEDGAGYTVHLQAWNCSCPAFALAAYAESSSAIHIPESSAIPEHHQHIGKGKGKDKEENGETRTPTRFGGLSIPQQRRHTAGGDQSAEREDARPAAGETESIVPPVCKHLLAVLLSEVAPGLFGPFAGDGKEAAPEESSYEEERRGAWEFTVSKGEAAGLAAGMGSGW